MILNVNPTRMELQNLKNKLAVAKRGHRLLKEKNDAMRIEFITLLEEAKAKRAHVELTLERHKQSYYLADMYEEPQIIEHALSLSDKARDIHVSLEKDALGSYFSYSPEHALDTSIHAIALESNLMSDSDAQEHLFKEILELASIEKRVQELASELTINRRRVNSLEHKTIPNLEETIRWINAKVDETERSQIARMTKIEF